jgi:hypothetical protein
VKLSQVHRNHSVKALVGQFCIGEGLRSETAVRFWAIVGLFSKKIVCRKIAPQTLSRTTYYSK